MCFADAGHCNPVVIWRILHSFLHRSALTLFLYPVRLEATLDSFLSVPLCFPRPSSTSARRSESTVECALLTHLGSYS